MGAPDSHGKINQYIWELPKETEILCFLFSAESINICINTWMSEGNWDFMFPLLNWLKHNFEFVNSPRDKCSCRENNCITADLTDSQILDLEMRHYRTPTSIHCTDLFQGNLGWMWMGHYIIACIYMSKTLLVSSDRDKLIIALVFKIFTGN